MTPVAPHAMRILSGSFGPPEAPVARLRTSPRRSVHRLRMTTRALRQPGCLGEGGFNLYALIGLGTAKVSRTKNISRTDALIASLNSPEIKLDLRVGRVGGGAKSGIFRDRGPATLSPGDFFRVRANFRDAKRARSRSLSGGPGVCRENASRHSRLRPALFRWIGACFGKGSSRLSIAAFIFLAAGGGGGRSKVRRGRWRTGRAGTRIFARDSGNFFCPASHCGQRSGRFSFPRARLPTSGAQPVLLRPWADAGRCSLSEGIPKKRREIQGGGGTSAAPVAR